jgi:hypothetical protein
MTAAQKKARENFSKAIAYRKKTGCTLKQAFAHVKGTSVKGLDKVVKKGNKTSVLYTKKTKTEPKKKVVKQGSLFGISAKNKANIEFWVTTFAPRKKSMQLEWYRELIANFKNGNFDVFTTKNKAEAQLRALEYILNKKPLIIK